MPPPAAHLARQLAVPLVTALFEEVADVGGKWWWDAVPGATEELRKAYQFDSYLVLTRVYRDDAEAGPGAGDAAEAGPPQPKRAKPEAPRPAALITPKPEDGAFLDSALWSFSFPAAVAEPTAVSDRSNQLTQMRLVMCVPAAVAHSPEFLRLVAAKV